MIDVVQMDSSGCESRRSSLQIGGARRLSAQFRNFFIERNAPEAGSDARSQPRSDASLVSNCVAKDLANLLFRAAAMTTRATLKLVFHILVELSDDHLSHATMLSR